MHAGEVELAVLKLLDDASRSAGAPGAQPIAKKRGQLRQTGPSVRCWTHIATGLGPHKAHLNSSNARPGCLRFSFSHELYSSKLQKCCAHMISERSDDSLYLEYRQNEAQIAELAAQCIAHLLFSAEDYDVDISSFTVLEQHVWSANVHAVQTPTEEEDESDEPEGGIFVCVAWTRGERSNEELDSQNESVFVRFCEAMAGLNGCLVGCTLMDLCEGKLEWTLLVHSTEERLHSVLGALFHFRSAMFEIGIKCRISVAAGELISGMFGSLESLHTQYMYVTGTAVAEARGLLVQCTADLPFLTCTDVCRQCVNLSFRTIPRPNLAFDGGHSIDASEPGFVFGVPSAATASFPVNVRIEVLAETRPAAIRLFEVVMAMFRELPPGGPQMYVLSSPAGRGRTKVLKTTRIIANKLGLRVTSLRCSQLKQNDQFCCLHELVLELLMPDEFARSVMRNHGRFAPPEHFAGMDHLDKSIARKVCNILSRVMWLDTDDEESGDFFSILSVHDVSWALSRLGEPKSSASGTAGPRPAAGLITVDDFEYIDDASKAVLLLLVRSNHCLLIASCNEDNLHHIDTAGPMVTVVELELMDFKSSSYAAHQLVENDGMVPLHMLDSVVALCQGEVAALEAALSYLRATMTVCATKLPDEIRSISAILQAHVQMLSTTPNGVSIAPLEFLKVSSSLLHDWSFSSSALQVIWSLLAALCIVLQAAVLRHVIRVRR